MVRTLRSDSITLHLIDEENRLQVESMLRGFVDSDVMIQEMNENYLPRYETARRMNYGFYVMLGDELAGLSLLSIDDWNRRTGSTGADTMLHMRGRGVAPGSKPHLFYLGFELLGLNRIETGCLVSNLASQRSIEKTPGFQLEGITRESGLNDSNEFEDEYRYAILRSDWLRLYEKTQIRAS